MKTDSTYIHGTEPEEQERLSLLNGLLNAASLRASRLRAGDRVLDLGCGLGQLSRAMAREVGPDGEVVGVDSGLAALERWRQHPQATLWYSTCWAEAMRPEGRDEAHAGASARVVDGRTVIVLRAP